MHRSFYCAAVSHAYGTVWLSQPQHPDLAVYLALGNTQGASQAHQRIKPYSPYYRVMAIGKALSFQARYKNNLVGEATVCNLPQYWHSVTVTSACITAAITLCTSADQTGWGHTVSGDPPASSPASRAGVLRTVQFSLVYLGTTAMAPFRVPPRPAARLACSTAPSPRPCRTRYQLRPDVACTQGRGTVMGPRMASPMAAPDDAQHLLKSLGPRSHG